MKIRARKSKRKTDYELEDFLLKEFSFDKEKFIPDPEISCNECLTDEDFKNHKDSALSFLIKLKADNLSDPSAIKSGVDAFVLPDDLNYKLQRVTSAFKSVSENHYNLILSEDELTELGRKLLVTATTHISHSSEEAKQYLLNSYQQSEWSALLNKSNKTGWRQYVGKILKERLYNEYGKIDAENVRGALQIDKEGFLHKVNEITRYANFDSKEMKFLSPYMRW